MTGFRREAYFFGEGTKHNDDNDDNDDNDTTKIDNDTAFVRDGQPVRAGLNGHADQRDDHASGGV